MKRVHGVTGKVKTLRSLLLLGGLLLSMTHAQAALLGVGGNTNVWPGIPNFYSESLAISYTPQTLTSGLFTATGTTSDYIDITNQDNFVLNDLDSFTPGTFSLSATVLTNGHLVSGTVSIACTDGIYDPNEDTPPMYGSGTLLQGNLTAFGFLGETSTNRSQFDVEFNVTGGELASVFGSTAGTVLYTEDYSFGGSFTTSFNNGGSGDADTLMMVPEPEPRFLVLLSVLGLCWVARWRASLRKG